MATTTGVVNRTGTARGARGKKPLARNPVVWIGGGLGAFLLLSHGGKGGASGSSTDPNAQLQSQADALAAEESAMMSPQIPGGYPSVDTGGGTYTSQGPSATTAPAVTVNINNPRKPKPHPKPKPKPHHKPKPKPKPQNGRQRQAHRSKPKPANRHGQHPPTQNRTRTGAHHNSPAMVESMQGSNSGVVVFGREFPGAYSHRLGPPMANPDGTVDRRVTVDYGGRTVVHMAHSNGRRWTDHAPGVNPPSRGVPALNRGEAY